MKNNFGAWLQMQLNAKAWNQADLAKASGLTTSAIAQFINNKVPPGKRGCSKIAKALNLPENIVFEEAGILSASPSSDPLTDEILHLARKLPPEDIQDLIDLARSKLARHERTQNATRKP